MPLFPPRKETRIRSVGITVLEMVFDVEVDHFVGSLVLHIEDHGCLCIWDEITLVLVVVVLVVEMIVLQMVVVPMGVELVILKFVILENDFPSIQEMEEVMMVEFQRVPWVLS
jgi:hypothetical protein